MSHAFTPLFVFSADAYAITAYIYSLTPYMLPMLPDSAADADADATPERD